MTPECQETIKKLIDYFEYDCTVDTFREYKHTNWEEISRDGYLSEDFIIEFQNKVYWMGISAHQKLSESFIRKFKDKVDWRWIYSCQKLSENFVAEFQHKICWGLFLMGRNQKDINNFSDIFFIEFAKQIKEFGKKEHIQRLENILNQTVDRTYDIIL